MTQNQDIIFALDIGTRTVVGVVFEKKEDKLVILDSEIVEHKSRSMLDGQIHNVAEVTTQVRKMRESLEEKLDIELEKVAIAAAGRALKTVKGQYEIKFENNREITDDDVKTLEFTAVQKAQEKLVANTQEEVHGYHFVGYSVINNKLNGMKIKDLTGQRGSKIEIELVATFLPRVVVDSLLMVIRQAGLEVEHLTLEPIAASSLLIPQQMHNFNLALVDIGAGTSDIAVTREGAIIGYAMVPVAGDEITEAICDTYMLDYHTAEKIKRKLVEEESVEVKDILDQRVEISSQKILHKIEGKIEELAELIAEEILNLNEEDPQAVICFGGGSLTPLLRDELAKALGMPVNRIGIKSTQDTDQIEGRIDGLSITQGITPLGIGMSNYNNSNRANFLDIKVNGDLIHLFTLSEPKVSDALLAAEIDLEKLEPTLGLALTIEVNDRVKVIPGQAGSSGKIMLNDEEVELDDYIKNGDEIEVQFGEESRPGVGVIADVVPKLESKDIIANGEKVSLEPKYYLDGELVDLDESLYDRAQITYQEVKTVMDAIEQVWNIPQQELKSEIINYKVNGRSKSISLNNYKIKLNGEETNLSSEVESGDELYFEFKPQFEVKPITVKDILEEVEIKTGMDILMNGRELKVPIDDFKLLKNGVEADLDAKVVSGDEIIYQIGEVTIEEVLNHINYTLSERNKEKIVLKKNKVESSVKELVEDGDRIDIYLRNKSTDMQEN
ncbi:MULTISPECIES: cell division protein FtsA [unclassified Candidatus Frackibacter]|uniref:cell division protein FtsA n=1 Tax=unclassified Candidatus Frackibacter TaxID=2648818 RepID=UPI00088750BA|nr:MULTISPECIES: cell division FtsA domain-containing protein [unclassified Candidatus Frackibacter]SDC12511.1 cell division protein FtsA [Candidatus Frackibacter sp. WG11]SEM35831.1 cell division protein FtsA [Candidatus Frackibacter sp. WG12]SFL41019.1 cell division protein FtsA [Candidatus Frackibacter sp. WG13]